MKNKKIYNLLFEQEESAPQPSNIKDPPEGNVSYKGNPGARKSKDSVDDQIDSILIKYESESMREKDEDASMNESFHKMNLKYLLMQQVLLLFQLVLKQ